MCTKVMASDPKAGLLVEMRLTSGPAGWSDGCPLDFLATMYLTIHRGHRCADEERWVGT